MGASFNDLPYELVVAITEQCGTKELLALARSCKRLSHIIPEKLYRHCYYRYVGTKKLGSNIYGRFDCKKTDHVPFSEAQSTHTCKPSRTGDKWQCSRCRKGYDDPVFRDDNVNPASTWIMDLPRFAEVISQRQDRRSLIHTMRLDLQKGGCNGVSYLRLSDHAMEIKKHPGSPNKVLDEAVGTILQKLRHLQPEEVLFRSHCSGRCRCTNRRSMITMGMPLPFLVLLPECKGNYIWEHAFVTESNGSEVHEIECELLYKGTDGGPISPSDVATQTNPRKQTKSNLYLCHYTGPLKDLGAILEIPLEKEAYVRWLERSEHWPWAWQTDSVRARILRHLHMERMLFGSDPDEPNVFPNKNHLFGDISMLTVDESVPGPSTRPKGHLPPNRITLTPELTKDDEDDSDYGEHDFEDAYWETGVYADYVCDDEDDDVYDLDEPNYDYSDDDDLDEGDKDQISEIMQEISDTRDNCSEDLVH